MFCNVLIVPAVCNPTRGRRKQKEVSAEGDMSQLVLDASYCTSVTDLTRDVSMLLVAEAIPVPSLELAPNSPLHTEPNQVTKS